MLQALCNYFDEFGVPVEHRCGDGIPFCLCGMSDLLLVRFQKRVLVPGAGLGRLVYEVAKRGNISH
jgi:hypothetical protein